MWHDKVKLYSNSQNFFSSDYRLRSTESVNLPKGCTSKQEQWQNEIINKRKRKKKIYSNHEPS